MDNNQVDQKQQQETKDIQESGVKDFPAPTKVDIPDACKDILNPQQEDSFDNVSDLADCVQSLIDVLDSFENNIINQLEEQVLDLKSQILAVDHALPDDELQNSKIVLMNTSRENFLEAFADSDAMENTPIGRDIRARHIHATMAAVDSIHGVFPMFPLGSADPKEADEHYNVLMNLAKLANRNTFHVYYGIDIPRVAYKVQNGQKVPLEKYSQLMERHKDIQEWMNDYTESPFYQKMSKDGTPALLRRVSAIFNPYLGHTETLSNYYQGQDKTDDSYFGLLDKSAWINPVSFIAQRLVSNYEKLGWCGGLFGLLNTARQISDYQNPKPVLSQKGMSFSKEMDYRYGLTLFNFLSDREGQRLIELGLTPLQRQLKDDEEWLALAEAQSLLQAPENFDDDMNKEKFEQMSNTKQDEYRAKATQKMYNYLGNCLLEDTVNRGLMLVCRKFIGAVGNATEDDLRASVKDFMTIFAGKPGSNNMAPYKSFSPALENYEIKDLYVSGQTAFVTVKIRPVSVLRRVVLFVDMNPMGFDIDVDADRY